MLMTMAKYIRSFILFLVLLPVSSVSNGNEPSFSEYDIKAAFIYNFAKFVDWPKDTFSEDNSPIILEILGKSPFGESLKNIEDKKVGSHPLKIIYSDGNEPIQDCHILFFCSSLGSRYKDVLDRLGNHPILTISEMEYFCSNGGIIRLFVSKERKVRFEINPDVAKLNGLKVSSQLLKIAMIVPNQPPKQDTNEDQ